MATPIDADWSGTSDGPAALRARLAVSVEDRLAWLEDAVDLAAAAGVLDARRARMTADEAADFGRLPRPVTLGG